MKFTYTAFDKAGRQSTAEIEATSLAEAREQLRRRSLYVTEISQAGEKNQSAGRRAGGRVGTGRRLRNVAMFSRQMNALIGSGTPIVQALLAIERQSEDANWTHVLTQMRKRVEEGSPLSEAMRLQSNQFDAVCHSLIAAGESGGNLPQMLERLAVLSRKQLAMRSMLTGAMVYPCVLIGMGLVVLVVMLMFVLPRFAMLFDNLDSPLPATTKMLMWTSNFLWSYWWAVLLGVVGAFFAVKMWLASQAGRRAIHTAAIKLPKIGKLTRSVMTARLGRMLGTLLESRVPLLDSLGLTKHSAVNVHYADLITRAEDAVSRGEPVSAVLGTSDLISACVQEAIRNGESSGKIGAPLLQMADFLDEENDVVFKSLTSILEPVILIVLGVIVGFIAMSMFLPLFDLVSAAQRG